MGCLVQCWEKNSACFQGCRKIFYSGGGGGRLGGGGAE